MGDFWFYLRDVPEHEIFDRSLDRVMTELFHLFSHVLQEGVAGPTAYHHNDIDWDLV